MTGPLTRSRKGGIPNLRLDRVVLAGGDLRLGDSNTGAQTFMPAPEAVEVLSPTPGLADNSNAVSGMTGDRPMRNLNDVRAIAWERARLADIRIYDGRLRSTFHDKCSELQHTPYVSEFSSGEDHCEIVRSARPYKTISVLQRP